MGWWCGDDGDDGDGCGMLVIKDDGSGRTIVMMMAVVVG